MPTKQETFDTVVAHLRKQGAKALDDKGCCYIAPNGMKCAAGCLIPMDLYSERLEGCSVHAGSIDDMWSTHAKTIARLMEDLGHDRSLVSDLQDCHDNSEVDDWETRFAEIAQARSLTYTPPA